MIDFFKDVKDGWVKYYINVKMDELVKTIDPTNTIENYYDGKLSDTRSILYCVSNIKEYLNEREYQKEKGVILTGIKIDFASYTNKGHVACNENKTKYKNRLIIQFEYVKKNKKGEDEIFDIDDQHEGRQPQCNTLNLLKGKEKILTADNGLLCPANCPH